MSCNRRVSTRIIAIAPRRNDPVGVRDDDLVKHFIAPDRYYLQRPPFLAVVMMVVMVVVMVVVVKP